ncbi:COMM domain-containing protein 9-like [Uloborus diversus]|uniref:COMM domain-containing protein 9-like n=1 Tax=Uloborus diversus TaxID=327109 RepID=UPI00240A6E18|nr:COMM domain-containing protein 9-like [Uloborus diversus]
MNKLSVNFEVLLLLLKASSKQQVIDICQDAFKHREKEVPPNTVLKSLVDSFSIETSEATKLFTALTGLIKFILFHGHSTHESISSLFPEDFHKNLKDLLSKILSDHFSSWKSAAVTSSISMPRLTEFDWRVDLKMASGKVARMNEPTCILHLKINDPGLPENHEDCHQTLNVELSKEKLDTMLHGLGRIRDQLSAVAKK